MLLENVPFYFSRADASAASLVMQAGTIAEYAVVKAEELASKPSNITHQEAASLPLVGLTAWQALETRLGLAANQHTQKLTVARLGNLSQHK